MSQEFIELFRKSQALIRSGNLVDAESICMGLLEQMPEQPDVLHLLGLIALTRGYYEEAIEHYKCAIRARPEYSLYYYNIGLSYMKSENFTEAISCFEKVIELDPNFSMVHSDLCMAYRSARKYDSALEAGKKAVELMPDNAAAHYNLALAYDAWKDFKTAAVYLEKAAQLAPNVSDIQYRLGSAYVGLGNIDAAKACFQKMLRQNSNQIGNYANLVRITRYRSPDHEDAVRIKTLLKQNALTDAERISGLFSLGKIYEDCGLYDEAFGYYRDANSLRNNMRDYDPVKFEKLINKTIQFFTGELLDKIKLCESLSEVPVFIVGMPRSGTTLVEQIISSHPDVYGAGELEWFACATDALPGFLQSSLPYPQCISMLTKSTAFELASKYLRYIRSLAGGEHRITDKTPGNFVLLGLIHALFPNARVIHCKRDPRDACISMFCRNFDKGMSYSYDLFNLGVHYAQYERLMAHWRLVLPADYMIDVEYEVLVKNQEYESRRLLDFLGLEWDEACRSFYKQNRAVVTSSELQVREPIYLTSIGRWRHYRKYLSRLEEGFKCESGEASETDNSSCANLPKHIG